MPVAISMALEACLAIYRQAVQTREQHRGIMRALGEQLVAARAVCPHGEWHEALRAHGIHIRTASRAMALVTGQGVRDENGKRAGAPGAGGEIGQGVRNGNPESAGAAGAESGSDWAWADEIGGETGTELVDEDPAPAGASGKQLDLGEVYESMAASRARVILAMDRLQEGLQAGKLAELAEWAEEALR